MKKLSAAVAVSLLTLTSACGGADTSTPASQSPSTDQSPSTEPSPSDEASSPADRDAKPRKSPAKQRPSPAGEQVLIGTVGTPEDPEGFTIELTTEAGEPVTTLPAGEYQVKVSDPATIHNFHLTGPGVEESTSVAETGEVTWKVTLEPGDYTYLCDPHPHEMSRQLTVT